MIVPGARGAEVSGEMPDCGYTRAALIQAALRRLGNEERRLLRLGLVRQADSIRRERRYWQFLDALFELPRSVPARRD